MRSLLATLVLGLVVLVAGSAPLEAGEPDAKELKAREKCAAGLVEWARWCAANGAPQAGGEALAEALGLGADASVTGDVAAALESAPAPGDEADAVARGRRTHGPKIAKLYDALADLKHEPADTTRFDGYVLRALAWEPVKARGRKVAQWIGGEDDAGRVARLLPRAWQAAGAGDAREPLDDLAAKRATEGLLLLGSADHELVAFVSLPRDWKRGRALPALVGVEGAGCAFEGYAKASVAARGSRGVIGVYPMTLSNTNALEKAKYPWYEQATLDTHGKDVLSRLAFDRAGVEALLDLLREHLGAEERVFLTGFSGGGQFTYYELLQAPSRVRGAVPCCGNFGGAGTAGAPGAGDGGGPPVLLLTGDTDPHREFTHGNKDMPGIEPQTDLAEKALASLGYTHVQRRMVKAGHSPLHPQVWDFVDEVLSAR